MHEEKENLLQKNNDQNVFKASCLIVEDNLINQKIMGKFLNKLGLDPDIAKDGVEAVEAVKNKIYDIIFMDIQMPRMDGIDATKCILNDLDLENKPIVIAVTANTSDSNKDKCFSCGMKDFISKPISLKIMKNTLSRWIG
ncbi:response regulator receiver domain protein [Candidatus Magnetomorum sp. HK-1]|nr:response regulator receiver domain protein [Candidatus Magnetomorum sp. HK-1]